MKKYLIISIIIHILIVSTIVYSMLNKSIDRQYYDFEVTIDTSNFSREVVVSEKSIARTDAVEDKAKRYMDELEIKNKSNFNIKESKRNKNDSDETLSKEQEYYIDIINGKINGHDLPMPKYPASAKKWGYMGTTIVEISINTLGIIVEVNLKKSSGYSILDRSVVSTIKNKWKNLPKPSRNIVVSKAFEFKITD